MQGLGVTAVASAAGLAGVLVGAGIWGGSLGQEVLNHERRISHHDARIERLETVVSDMRSDLRVIREILERREAGAGGR